MQQLKKSISTKFFNLNVVVVFVSVMCVCVCVCVYIATLQQLYKYITMYSTQLNMYYTGPVSYTHLDVYKRQRRHIQNC